MEMKVEHNSAGKRVKSMLKVDFRRMFTTPLFYIMAGIAFVIPILVLIMTTSFSGTTSVDPVTGVETAAEMEPFTNAWQVVESPSGEAAAINADNAMMSMCNINLLYFLAAVFLCIFITEDFRSGYAKNLFTVRAKKTDYVLSKTLAGFAAGACMILAYLVGTVLGGAIAGLSFDPGIAGAGGIFLCLLSKAFLMAVFVPIFTAVSVVGKQKLWLSLVGSFCVGMLFFMMIPMLTPLNSSVMNAALCFAGGVLFSIGLGAVSNTVLQKTSLV